MGQHGFLSPQLVQKLSMFGKDARILENKIYQAKSTYYNYGLEFNNRLSKEFRLSETIKFRPYVGLDLAYGRFTNIKEKNVTSKFIQNIFHVSEILSLINSSRAVAYLLFP